MKILISIVKSASLLKLIKTFFVC